MLFPILTGGNTHSVQEYSWIIAKFKGKPILRSISMNAFMDAQSFGASPDWIVTSPNNPMDPNHPVYTKEPQITQPSQTWLVLDEDQASINDAMFVVDVGGGRQFIDLPARSHAFGYGINFNDGHAEIWVLRDPESRAWVRPDLGGFNDWSRLTNVTTHAVR